jgi:hypothetical protein
MLAYQPALLPGADWSPHAAEALCIVRRSKPATETELRIRLAVLAGFLRHAQVPPGQVTNRLTEARIRSYTRTIDVPQTRTRTEHRLQLLRCAAHQLPLPERPRRRRRPPAAVTPRKGTAQRIELLSSGLPTVECLHQLQLTHGQLQALIDRLPKADLAANRTVLRG